MVDKKLDMDSDEKMVKDEPVVKEPVTEPEAPTKPIKAVRTSRARGPVADPDTTLIQHARGLKTTLVSIKAALDDALGGGNDKVGEIRAAASDASNRLDAMCDELTNALAEYEGGIVAKREHDDENVSS